MKLHGSGMLNSVYGCDIGETSGDDSRKGGYYTQSLLKACYNFQDKYKNESKSYYLSCAIAHEQAKKLVVKLKSDQNPQIEKPRSGNYFPLAIIVN